MVGSSSSTAKAQHYTEAISGLLCGGAWGDRAPVKAYNGSALDVREGARKWAKHTGGNPALISALHNLSLLYLSAPSDSRRSSAYEGSPQSTASHAAPSDGSGSSASFVHVPRARTSMPDMAGAAGAQRLDSRRSMDVQRRAATPLGTRESRGMPAGGSLSVTELDRDESEAVILRERGGWFTGVPRERIADVEAGLREVEAATSGKGASGADADFAIILKAYHLHALRRHDEALASLEACSWRTSSESGDNLTSAARIGTLVRGRCIQGMSYELSSSPTQALECYRSALSLLLQIPDFQRSHTLAFLAEPSAAATPSAAKTGPPFAAHRETLRWVSIALCRGAVLSARTPQHEATLQWLRDYHTLARSWPASFRPRQRTFMLNLYMRALHAACPAPHAVVPQDHQWSTQINLGEIALGSAHPHRIWMRETRQAMQQGQDLLAATTSFPRAGEVNVPVTEYFKACVALWQRGGCSIAEGRAVSKILWWAMTMTFHSQPLLRSLTLVLQAIGSVEDARRTFELYVALVLKSRQTSQPDVALQLQRRPTEDHAAAPAAIAQQVAAEHVPKQESVEHAISVQQDTDEEFLAALLLGVRLLTRDLSDPKEAWRYAILAGEVIERATGHIDLRLKALVEASKGVVRVAMTLHDADPESRATWQAQGIDHLVASTLMDHTNSQTYYHLAYARAEARDIAQATFSIRTALELDPKNVEAWHLLALLRTADKDWQSALKAVEVGLQAWEATEGSLAGPDVGSQPEANANLSPRDFAMPQVIQEQETPIATSPAATALVSGTVLLPAGAESLTAHPMPSPVRRLEMMIQLRMTEAVIVEKLHGQEIALQKQQESFAFFSARSGYSRAGGSGTPETSPSIRTQSMRERPGSFAAAAEVPRSSAELQTGGAEPTAAPYTVSSVASPPRLQIDAAPPEDSPSRRSTAASIASHPHDAEDRDPHRRPKFLPKHLHVPGTRRSGRASSLGQRPAVESEKAMHRSRTISDGSSIFSRAQTPAHSHYHGTRSPPVAPPPQPAAVPTGRTPEETRVLSNLWLMSAATFRRAGQPQQALVAIQEAELMDPENADVWLQLGLYHVDMGDRQTALESLAKALVMRPEYPPAVVNLAIVYFKLGQVDMAHGLLNSLTQANGWDVPEAFLWLAQVCEKQDRSARAQELLRFALTLERTRTCRPIESVVSRFL